ncbi:hypothetical protein DL93DRAFT_2165572 [Clavulina sp. PMI_390]|nr:hypothetical protein DL93DRAFT_2165572 [Clavulina sp. PMI_390]
MASSDTLAPLPLEIFEHICVLAGPRGVAAISECSWHFQRFIESSTHIWRTFYLERWDDPRTSPYAPIEDFDWKSEAQAGVRAEYIIRALKAAKPPFEIPSKLLLDSEEAYEQCVRILLRSSGSVIQGKTTSRTLGWLTDLVGPVAVSLWPWIIPAPVYNEEHIPDVYPQDGNNQSAYALLSSLQRSKRRPLSSPYLTHQRARWVFSERMGIPPPPKSSPLPLDTCKDLVPAEHTRIAARAYIYDTSHYSTRTLWGPWVSEDDTFDITETPKALVPHRPNWEHIINIIISSLINMEEHNIHHRSEPETLPVDFLCTRPFSAPGWDDRPAGDWAGVQGVWRRVFSFMNYAHLAEYNGFLGPDGWAVNPPPNFKRSNRIFVDDDFAEEFRVLTAALQITRIEDPSTGPDPNRPRIHFSGTSHGWGPHQTTVKGHVSVTASGDIRWWMFDEVTTVDAQNRWLSSGVQVGGIGSAMGMIGCWSPADHSTMHDPGGPFWAWKVGGASDMDV